LKGIFLLLAALLISASPLVSYAEEKGQQATTKEASSEKVQYEKSAEERLRKIGKQLDELKARAETKTGQARKEMSKHIAEAEKKQQAAAKKLEELRKQSAKKWKKVSSEMSRAVDDFEQAYEKAKSRFKE